MIGSASPRPNLLYRLLHRLFRLVAQALFRVRVSGMANLPRDAGGRAAGGWICCAVPHRNWVEPFLLMTILPAEPRPIILADGPTAAGSWWRRLIVGRFGGVIPIWSRSGTRAFAAHLAAAATVVRKRAILAVFAEVGPPSRPPALRRLSAGVAYFAQHTGAPVVPVVFGGTHELYLRRRIDVRILAPLKPPPPGANRADTAAWMDSFRSLTEAAAGSAHAAAEASPPARKRWTWLTGNFPRAG